MAHKKAVRPDFFAHLEALKRSNTKKDETTKEEKALYAMSLSDGWRLFNNKAERLLEDMDGINDQAVAQGATYEELGKNTVVISLAKGVIKRLINLVEDAKNACERPNGGV